ncbi:unnamed protein product [Parnassius apollo]|uniref:(apollo) hypothetical protein n=1 Tax=Parnassius apollo TaxID=110799 RepID=A0A8S3Y6F7_PARAO|nr:unnamed protein product [Parnassius apollo]
MEPAFGLLEKRQLPKLMACMTQNSIENFRNKALFSLDTIDAKGIRRRKLPLHECLTLELREAGFFETSDYLQNLIYDNIQILAQDDIGIVIDLRKKEDFLEHICAGLQKAERERDKDNKKKECLELLKLAMYYSEMGKGILWLAEKFFLASIAVGSHYLVDGGRQKACCKYHYASFLLDKYLASFQKENEIELSNPGSSGIQSKFENFSPSKLRPFPKAAARKQSINSRRKRKSAVLTDTPEKDSLKKSMKKKLAKIKKLVTKLKEKAKEKEKDWVLFEDESEIKHDIPNSVFAATVLQLHRVLLQKARMIRNEDPAKSERLSRLAERRAKDATDTPKIAEAIIEIGISQLTMNNLNNALRTFEKAFKIYSASKDIHGMCETKMHLAAVMQKIGDNEAAAKYLTEMGALAMEHGLRKHLGRALHLLGELHLRRERPDLGTQHLAEAFTCFMGYLVQDIWKKEASMLKIRANLPTDLDVIYESDETEKYVEEAEQSRVMMAVSRGQELITSYFKQIKDASSCVVAEIKIIEWKLSKVGWWVDQDHHRFIPCSCSVHHRTPLDILR